MTGKEALRFAMEEKKMTYQSVADSAGYGRPTNVSEILRSNNARIDNLLRVLNACGYDLVMVDRSDKRKKYSLETNDPTPGAGVK